MASKESAPTSSNTSKIYHEINNEGNVRAHIGDHIETKNYYGTAAKAPEDESARRQEGIEIIKWLGYTRTGPPTRPRLARGTGAWFFDHSMYSTWLSTPASATILEGKVGCGKTTLVTAIEDRLRTSDEHSSSRIITFYSGFLSSSGMCLDQLLRAIVVGILDPEDVPKSLRHLYLSYSKYGGLEQPPSSELEFAITAMLKSSQTDVYLVVDALDEILESEQSDVVDVLLRFVRIRIPKLHVLVVSRPSSFLRHFQLRGNGLWNFETIPMEAVRRDIVRFVEEEMERHERLAVLEPELKQLVEERLIAPYNDQFRWTSLQLTRLRNLPLSTRNDVETALKNLPETLNDTYERTLLGLQWAAEKHSSAIAAFAKAAIHLLAFTRYPLYVEEFLDALTAMLFAGEVGRQHRMRPSDLPRLLPGMLQISPELDSKTPNPPTAKRHFVLFEHFSVREYLTGASIRQSQASSFAAEECDSNGVIAGTCMQYLLYASSAQTGERDFPFAEYAWLFWSYHLRAAQSDDEAGILSFYQDMRAHNPHQPSHTQRHVPSESMRKAYFEQATDTLLSRRATPQTVAKDALYNAIELPFYLRTEPTKTPMLEQDISISASLRETTQIQLLLLDQPRYPNSLIHGRLVTVELEHAPRFLAFSCSWDRGHTFRIFIDGRPVGCGPCLLFFLVSLTRNSLDASRYVWVDELCYNHEDSAEKIVYRDLTPRIYQRASETTLGGRVSTKADTWLVNYIQEASKAFQEGIDVNVASVMEFPRKVYMTPDNSVLLLLVGPFMEEQSGAIELMSTKSATMILERGIALPNHALDTLLARTTETFSRLDRIMSTSNTAERLLSFPQFTSACCVWDVKTRVNNGVTLGMHQLLYGTRHFVAQSARERFESFITSGLLRPSLGSMENLEKLVDVICRWNAFIANEYGILGLLADALDSKTSLAPSWATQAIIPRPKWPTSSNSAENILPLCFRNLHTVDESDINAGKAQQRLHSFPTQNCFRSPAKFVAEISNILSQASSSRVGIFSPRFPVNLVDTPSHIKHSPASGILSKRASSNARSIGSEAPERYRQGRRTAILSLQGITALVPERAKISDRIFIFPGFRSPYVLREKIEMRMNALNLEDSKELPRVGNATEKDFEFVGEAYVPGLMYGEALESVEDVSKLPEINVW